MGRVLFTFPIHCIQCDRYLIVSDHLNIALKFSTGMETFSTSLESGVEGTGSLSYPRCLSVNKSGHLMVCDSGNHRIQVFELNGKFVGKFGTNGSNLGEFANPITLAFLSNGRIAVSELSNHRVQIFE